MSSKLANVVYVANRASILGGAEKVACLEAIGTARKGLSVTLLAGAGPTSPELVDAGVKVVCLEQALISEDSSKLRGFVHGLWNFEAERAIRSILKELDPSSTVVHLHSWAHVLSASVLRPVRQLGFPLVVTAHDYFLACPNGGLLDYRRMEKCALRPLSRECLFCNCDKRSYAQKLYRCLRWRLQRRELSRISNVTVATISDMGEKLIKIRAEASGLKSTYYFRLLNPIELPNHDLVNEDCPYHNDSFYLFVGRMSLEKGPRLLCEASSDLRHRVVLIGDGPLLENLRSDYPDCDFLGRMELGEIASYYARARALVVPSLWYEGLSLAVCEGKALKAAPIVTPSDCAATEAAGYFDDELTFESGNAGSLATVLNRLDDDAELARAREKPCAVAPVMALENHVASLLRLYQEVLDRAG